MKYYTKLVYTDVEPSSKEHSKEIIWTHHYQHNPLLVNHNQETGSYLTELAYKLESRPECLTEHLQRIYCCYQGNLNDSLYAALVDLLIVLNKRGKDISRRLVAGTASKLTERQRSLLNAALNDEIDDISTIEGNCFSLFSRGLSGTVKLVEKLTSNSSNAHDPLQLAKDAVEYFQLEEAMAILEQSIADHPGRIELHEFLLQLYKSTNNRARFECNFAEFRNSSSFASNRKIQETWNQLNDYFEHR